MSEVTFEKDSDSDIFIPLRSITISVLSQVVFKQLNKI